MEKFLSSFSFLTMLDYVCGIMSIFYGAMQLIFNIYEE